MVGRVERGFSPALPQKRAPKKTRDLIGYENGRVTVGPQRSFGLGRRRGPLFLVRPLRAFRSSRHHGHLSQ